jgi:carboxymethylenebutenolidase
MCDDDTVVENERYLKQNGLTRRSFNKLSAAIAATAILPSVLNAASVTESDVNVITPDGTADCYFVHPAKGKYPGVIIWPDILGLRPAFRSMGKRLAESGYSVLVVNPYYRSAKAPVVSEGDSFQDDAVRNKVLPMARSLSAETVVTDARAFVDFLDSKDAVDINKKIGTTGYCMGGSFTMRTAAHIPDRIGAGASFHGGRLVTDGPDSPHLLASKMKAHFLFAIAANDDDRDPNAKDVLRKTFKEAKLRAEVEVYEGAMHGWCPPDSRVYNEAQAEHAWARLLVLFKKALV